MEVRLINYFRLLISTRDPLRIHEQVECPRWILLGICIDLGGEKAVATLLSLFPPTLHAQGVLLLPSNGISILPMALQVAIFCKPLYANL